MKKRTIEERQANPISDHIAPRLVAYLPTRLATRVDPAVALRSE